jgi:hypothetical protein
MPQNRGVGRGKASDADKALRSAFPRGGWLDLRTGVDALDDAAGGQRWGRERALRAETITALLLGAFKTAPGHSPAVRVRGARITGRLDLMGATTGYALICEGCWFEQPLRFVEATTKTLRIITSHMPGMNCTRMRAEGLVNLYGSVIDGLLRLDQAQIAGEVFLMGAQVGDGTGEAMAARLVVDGDLQCTDGFTARGSVNLRGARITGRLSFRGAALDAPDSARRDASGLHLGQLQAAELDLRAARPIFGGIRLTNSRVGTLDDDPAVWPQRIWLDDFERHEALSNRVEVGDLHRQAVAAVWQ